MNLHTVCLVVLCIFSSNQVASGDFNLSLNNAVDKRVAEFFEYCPYTSTCWINQSQPKPLLYTEYWYEAPCCLPCDCHGRCGMSCCADISKSYGSIDEIIQKKENNWSPCRYAQHRIFNDKRANGKAFNIVSSCPIWYNDSDIANKCKRQYQNLTFNFPLRYILPVYDTNTYLIFNNIFCTKCHNVPENDLEFADIRFTCIDEKRNITYIDDLLFLPNKAQEDGCNIWFSFPKTLDIRSCIMGLTDRCNVTGLWESYDKHLEESCLSYTSVYDKYMNVHCFLCNGHNESEIKHICNFSVVTLDPHFEFSGDFYFIRVIDWTEMQQLRMEKSYKEEEGNLECKVKDVLDSSKAEDRQLQCIGGMVNVDGMCFFPYLTGTVEAMIEIDLLLEPNDSLTHQTRISLYKLLSIIIHKTESVKSVLVTKDIQIHSIVGFISFRNDMEHFGIQNSSFHVKSIKFVALKIKVFGKNVHIHYFQTILDFALAFTAKSSFDGFMKRFRYFEEVYLADKSNCTYYAFNNVYSVCSSQYSPEQLDFLLLNLQVNETNQTSVITINIEPEPFCPRIALPKTQFCQTGIYSDIQDPEFFVTKKLSENKTHEFYCYKDYLKHFGSENDKADDTGKDYVPSYILKYLSIACLSVSLFALIITLIVYSVFPVLRSLPGLNNMALVTSLIMFQATALISTLTSVNIDWLCSFIGAFTHFSLILSFSWMFICTFHMMNVFRKIRNPGFHRNNRRTFIKYFCFAGALATTIVTVTILFSAALTDGKTVGYGGSDCYIISYVTVLCAVALPVGLATGLNICMFGIVVFKFQTLSSLASSNLRARNNMVIFMKLSTITGMTWLFGFIYAFTQFELLAYIFVILNASQGIFILMSFACTQRVWNLACNESRRATELKQITSNEG